MPRTKWEMEMHTAPPEWQYSRRSYEFANGFFMEMVGAALEEEGATAIATNTAVNPSELDKKVKLEREIHCPCFRHSRPTRPDGTNDDVGSRLAHHHASPLPEDKANLPNGTLCLEYLHTIEHPLSRGCRTHGKWKADW